MQYSFALLTSQNTKEKLTNFISAFGWGWGSSRDLWVCLPWNYISSKWYSNWPAVIYPRTVLSRMGFTYSVDKWQDKPCVWEAGQGHLTCCRSARHQPLYYPSYYSAHSPPGNWEAMGLEHQERGKRPSVCCFGPGTAVPHSLLCVLLSAEDRLVCPGGTQVWTSLSSNPLKQVSQALSSVAILSYPLPSIALANNSLESSRKRIRWGKCFLTRCQSHGIVPRTPLSDKKLIRL